jgi:hypothetical protein
VRAPAADRAERFGDLVRAEWTKFRTMTGWVAGALLVVVTTVFFSLAFGGGAPSCPKTGRCPTMPIGPDREAVADTFYFVHRTLAGDGTVTAEVLSLSGLMPSPRSIMQGQATGNLSVELAGARPGLQPWAKAGLIVTEGTRPGAPYAAVMLTGRHGVRFQYDYTHDRAGPVGSATAVHPTWLRLRRLGDAVAAFESADGTHWVRMGSAHLSGLPAHVQVGLFVASPQYAHLSLNLGFLVNSSGSPTEATAVFTRVLATGRMSRAWRGTVVGPNADYPALAGRFTAGGERFTVSGSGDIAPQVGGIEGGGVTIASALKGTFAGLISLVLLAAAMAASEYRRGLLVATFASSPRRGRALAAKMLVTGLVAFAAGSAGAALSLAVVVHFLKAQHAVVYPVAFATDTRVVAGTGLLMALAAIAIGSLSLALRGGAGAVAAGFALLVLPWAVVGALPTPVAEWLLRVSPAAAMAVQQVARTYPQVAGIYTPANGYYPLSPLVGLAVLTAYAALALAVAFVALRRRDA